MKIKNETGLPQPLVAIAEKLVNEHPVFDNSVYSVTELFKSEQQAVLSRRNPDKVEMDIQDTFSMWNGTAIHNLLEDTADRDRYITEERIKEEIAPSLFISGAFDLLDKSDWSLYDYKTTKVATYNKMMSGSDDKWLKQLYAYADMIELKFGRRPMKATIIAMLTDHSKIKASTQPGYPSNPIMQITWKLDDPELQEMFRAERCSKAERFRHLMETGEEPEPCTYGDCWCKEDYAVMKSGSKRALKVFDNEDEARSALKGLGEGYRLFHRVSDYMNCRNYCQCRSFCKQWERIKDNEAVCEDITDNEYIPF